ncbi:DUF3149 domain-containing protein [Aliikangiella coralliicola]|uniref:DUF3149 domain-containing protein n=1 Tax=Aliikangiella coralliicola TaxID=2592383 RepID=A0A545TZZ5_9GAMM|nr:DUF3149 domain-containing protein [Aliikangiella coralliicola]TQV82790.1 DUF3149 domain-containing protein [Aliikangiella coralliicola]
MELFKELFSSAEGLLSLGVILFMIFMGTYLARMFIKKMNQKPDAD